MENQHFSRFDSKRLIENREMRIFLSSTFSDMYAERTALVKTFHTLEVEANCRNVTMSVIDLRWGVTDEETRLGKVLSVCFQEIEHSHPFFIGMLGSRYGTSPDVSELEKNPELEERYPWLIQDIEDGMSITEMEMQYGILRNTKDVDAAFFIKAIPGTDPDDNERLTRLKEKIMSQDRFVHDVYHSIDDLCTQVAHAVRGILDKHFPVGEFNELDRERTAQKAYINSRHGIYQRKQADFDRIDAFLTNDETHLVITGPSGMGKSALIANWLKEQEDKQLPCNIIYHFVGNSFSGSDYREVLQHICNEIYSLYGLERLERMNESLEDEAQRILVEAGHAGKPLLIVIDGINQIIDRDYSKLLNWLPQAPKTAKYLFSTLDCDETMATFMRRGYPQHQIGTLDQDQRRKFILDYLAHVGKRLTSGQLNRILEDPKNENMLVLRTLLDELICFGSHEHLDERISYYLMASSIEDFFDRLLQRMEDDYKEVRRMLSLVAISENGLSEDELQAIVGLRPIDFHLFYCAFYNHTVTRKGLITFAHQYISNAVWKRYGLSDPENANRYRNQIIAHMAASNTTNARKISELAFQYYHTENMPKLYEVLMSFEAFRHFSVTDRDQATLASYWRKLLMIDPEKYQLRNYLDLPLDGISPKDLPYLQLGNFVQAFFGDYNTSMYYYQEYLNISLDSNDENNAEVATAYNNIGAVYSAQGEFEEAFESISKALTINERILGVDHPNTATSYSNLGQIYDFQRDYPQALEYYFKALDIRERVMGEDHPSTAISYNNIGGVYCYKGDYPQALDYYSKALAINERVMGEDHSHTATFYGNIGQVYCFQGDYSQALVYCLKAMNINERVLGVDHPITATSYNNIGGIYNEQGNYPQALEYFHKALAVRERALGTNHPDTAISYSNIGGVYDSKGDYPRALEYYFKALSIEERVLGIDHPSTAVSYNNIGFVYCNQGDYPQALEYYFKALSIKERVLGIDHPATATSYNNIGGVYDSQGDYPRALEYYFKALSIDEHVLGIDYPSTATDYNNIGLVYNRQANYLQALEYFQKAFDIFEHIFGVDHPNSLVVKKNLEAVKAAMG